MHVFITGATGWIGSATVDDLLAAGHKVVGLARSDASAAALEAKGAVAARGDLDDPGSLRRGAEEADAVVHLANKHDWANPEENDRADRAAIAAMAATLAGTDRPLVVVDGFSDVARARMARARVARDDPAHARMARARVARVARDDPARDDPARDRPILETDGADRDAGPGVRTISVRFAPTVHGAGDWGFVTFLADAARRTGVSAYLGDGATRWSAVHVRDAARLIRLGVESAPAGACLHAVAEESIPIRTIAEALGQALDLPVAPVDDPAHFGVVGHFLGLNMSASSARTRELLGWHPTGPTLIEDIRAGAYTHDD